MSAFICGPKTFSDIYSGLAIYGSSPLRSYDGVASTTEKVLEGKQTEEFIEILYRLNVRAVNQRYIENTPEHLTRETLKTLCGFNPHVSIYQFLKSLECLHYQMCEGEVPATKPYEQIQDLINSVSRSIAHNCEEYERATWD
jgi:hypothetical protein